MHQLTIFDLNFGFTTEEEVHAVSNALAKRGYRPLYRSMIQSAATVFGVDKFDSQPGSIFRNEHQSYDDDEVVPPFPEMFSKDKYIFGLVPYKESTRVITVRRGDATCEIDFEKDIVECINEEIDGRRTKNWHYETPNPRLKEFPRVRRGLNTREDKFTELSLHPAQYSAEELHMATLLADDKLRAGVFSIARSGKTKIADAEKDLSLHQIGQLRSHGLVRTEYLVQCRGNSATLCTVPDKDELISAHGSKLRCPHCNRLFRDELISDILSVSEACKNLTDKSHWMTIWVTSLIVSAGIPLASVSWNAIVHSDEIDIIVDVFGSKIFFELKDREFGLGDAYPFNHRFHRYGGDYGIVISTATIAAEASKFFKEQGARREFRFFENSETIPTTLVKDLREIAKNTLVSQLMRGFAASGVNERSWVNQWLR